MNTIDKIPVSKIQRASKLVSTGAKIGVNYLKYYGDQLVSNKNEAREKLNQNNAEDIYDSLKELKGSALKVAQMLSMDKSIMPSAYVEKFSLSQFSVPPLSPPLVLKTFRKYFGMHPNQLFDYFNPTSINAASIGQVHLAEKDGKKLAVKIQYPGVADSISSDLALVKPIALSMFNIKAKDSDQYFKEVENKLMEETDYVLELSQSVEISEACKHIPNLVFPEYYPQYSSERILTMDYMYGKHLPEIDIDLYTQEERNKLGQALWDFYMYQMHILKKVHADPHPGNFMISKDNELIVLDFGCLKAIPEDFYTPYFKVVSAVQNSSSKEMEDLMTELELIKSEDSTSEKEFFKLMFNEILEIFTEPFKSDTFDFSNPTFFERITQLGEKYSKSSELRKLNANRGSKHFIYMNRTFFGLYNLMVDLKANNIHINNYLKYAD
ncbi:MAG: AarF/ABC1/UbiB kinase family protein [Flavobacteriaceae bacterium]|nr:AarF/ABC1/UbiB kinase family protein [Flavobacteriaceae bacterium]